jgi:hypothetical protein
MDNEEYQQWSKGAHRYAKNFIEQTDIQESYRQLFAVHQK